MNRSRANRCRGYEAVLSRRELFGRFGTGLTGIALASLLQHRGAAANSVSGDAADPPPHHAPRAKRVVQIFLQGGLSHVDSFEYKPGLEKHHGQSIPGERPDVIFDQVGLLHKPHFTFKQHGRSGLWISDLFPHIAERADQLTVINSMYAESANHTPATYQMNSGFRTLGFPAAGAWISYGLGAETDDLPAFVVIPDARGVPSGAANHWTNGFLPARHQGVMFRTRGPAVAGLEPPEPLDDATRTARFQLLDDLNRRHAAKHAGEDALAARIRSYELAAKMQLAVPEATDLSQETRETQELYGLEREDCGDFARGCLLARRLLERGVRFIQLWSGASFMGDLHWDAHGDVPANHRREAVKIDRPVAALLDDLRRTGLLEDTLVVFNSEFGRTPFAQTAEGKLGPGRDHNQLGFSVWMAGAGLKPGIAYGATDELGYRAVVNPVSLYDFHATVLHLLGINHERLTYYHNGIQRRLTNVHGHVVHDLFA
jgi:hypothetical protein